MGDGHPLFQLPPTRREIIQRKTSALIIRNFAEQIKALKRPEDQQNLYLALTMLTLSNAEDVLNEKIVFSPEWAELRNKFIADVSSHYSELSAEIHASLLESKESGISSADDKYINYELMDVGGSGRAVQLYPFHFEFRSFGSVIAS